LSPSPFKERGIILEEGLTPLLDTLKRGCFSERMGKRGARETEESQREAKPLLYIHSPFPLIRGRGEKGDGVTT